MTMIAKPTKPKEVPTVVKKEEKVKKETKKAPEKQVEKPADK